MHDCLQLKMVFQSLYKFKNKKKWLIFRRAHGGRRSRCVGQLQRQETAPPFLVSFGIYSKLKSSFSLPSVLRDRWFLLQHGDCQQHPVGGWDPSSWNVLAERLRSSKEAVAIVILTSWDCCYQEILSTCSHRRNSEAPQSNWETAVKTLPSFTAFVRNHCHPLFVMVFSLICHYLPLIGLFIAFVKSTDLCHLILFLPLKGSLASEVFHVVFFLTLHHLRSHADSS